MNQIPLGNSAGIDTDYVQYWHKRAFWENCIGCVHWAVAGNRCREALEPWMKYCPRGVKKEKVEAEPCPTCAHFDAGAAWWNCVERNKWLAQGCHVARRLAERPLENMGGEHSVANCELCADDNPKTDHCVRKDTTKTWPDCWRERAGEEAEDTKLGCKTCRWQDPAVNGCRYPRSPRPEMPECYEPSQSHVRSTHEHLHGHAAEDEFGQPGTMHHRHAHPAPHHEEG